MDPFTESNKNKIKIEDSSRCGGSYEPERWMVTKYRKLFYVIQFIRLSRSEERKNEQHLYGSWINLASIKQSVRTSQEILYIGLFTGSTLLLYLKNHTEHHYR